MMMWVCEVVLSCNKWMVSWEAVSYGMIDKVLRTPMPKMPEVPKSNFGINDDAGL